MSDTISAVDQAGTDGQHLCMAAAPASEGIESMTVCTGWPEQDCQQVWNGLQQSSDTVDCDLWADRAAGGWKQRC